MNRTEDLRMAQEGDLLALGRVIAETRGLAAGAARKLARKASRPDLIEDLVAAAIAGSATGVGGLIQAARTFNPSLGSWEGWAYSHAARGARSELRLQAKAGVFIDELGEDNEPGTGDEDSMIAEIDARARLPKVVRALTHCSHNERQVLEKTLEGAKVADVAADLGVARSRVRGYLAEAREKLRTA